MPPLQNVPNGAERPPFKAPALPHLGLTVDDLRELAHLAPAGALDLAGAIGAGPAVALMLGLGGAQVMVPKHPNHNRAGARTWAQLAEIVGDDAMPRLAARYGGFFLDVPLCTRLLAEKRDSWVRNRFDQLTHSKGPALSAREAVRTIGLDLAGAGKPLTYRAIERIIN
jgi:hypothetical protein